MQILEGPREGERIYTVGEITASVKDTIENRFPHLWIVGEISNCTLHSSGHAYFTLKDDIAQISCVLFRSARQIAVSPEDGLKVFAQGRISVYEKRGQYQLIVNTILPVGRGDLYAAFNELKARLEKEGLFDPSRKKELPRFASRLGVVTSPTGAAVRDVIRIARKIYAGVEIIVYPVKVQGEGAAEDISTAIRDLNSFGEVDVIILARGGGSIEDLWAFNEEVVARAIRASSIPVVSAVGHEIDFTIADFAADARAPTPSAAPTIVLADYVDVRTRLDSFLRHAIRAVTVKLGTHRRFLESLATRYGLRRIKDRLFTAARDLDEAVTLAERLVKSRIESEKSALANLVGKIESLNPLSTLRRGYSVCYKQDTDERVTSYRQVNPGDHVRVLFAEGRAICEVERADKEIG
jgi:exodeoxyribonuclease VII large subunit